MAKKKPTFEQALHQLEQIADQIERGEIGLEESITRYEEAMALVEHCRGILAQAELRIEKLQQRADSSCDAPASADPEPTEADKPDGPLDAEPPRDS